MDLATRIKNCSAALEQADTLFKLRGCLGELSDIRMDADWDALPQEARELHWQLVGQQSRLETALKSRAKWIVNIDMHQPY